MTARLTSPFALRLAIVALALMIAALVVRHGLATSLADDKPALALRIDGGDARALVEAARTAIDSGSQPQDESVARLTHRALSRDLTQPIAIEFRALQAVAAGDAARAHRLFALSSAISRRSLPTRMWLIEEAVGRNDVVGALDHFDIALRTSKAAPATLFPILASATTDPVLASAIARLLDRKPVWAPDFLYFTITDAKIADGAAAVMLRMRERAAIRRRGIDQTLIGQLVADGRFATARRVYSSFDPGHAKPGLIADPRFTDASARFPFGWSLADRDDIAAQRGNVDGRTILSYQAVSGATGNAASQLLMLPAGNYRLSVATAEPATDPGAPPVWTMTCAQKGGMQIAVLVQPAKSGSTSAGDFAVPADCPAQWIALNLPASAASDGQSGSVASISIARR